MAIQAILLCLAFSLGVQSLPDPCQQGNYQEINDNRRSTNYHTVLSENTLLCDHLIQPGWYRFTSSMGGTIPEKCVPRSRCGTEAPIWLHDTHPTVAEGMVGKTACVNLNQGSSCCDLHIQIGVKNCNGYYVYYLQPTNGCPIAYCAGDGEPCPSGQWSASGTKPCTDVYPIMTTYPTLSFPEVNDHAFQYTCTINHPENNPDLVYELQWTFDGKEDNNIPIKRLTSNQRQAILPGTELHGHMGQEVSCRVRAWYQNRPVVQKSEWRNSTESRWAAITVEPARVVVDEKGGNVTLKLTSTVPIVCTHNITRAACCITIMLDVDGPTDEVAVGHSCNYKLCASDWNNATHTASTEISITAVKDQIKDGDKQLLLEFDKIQAVGGPYIDVFTGYRIQNVPVTTKNADSKICKWHGDPHFIGFTEELFDSFDVGDFTVYENKVDNFEVQSRMRPCGDSGATCQCGLAIREHEDLITLDGCADMNHPPVLTVNRQLREGTFIQRSPDGRNILIILPSGREIRLESVAYWGREHMWQNTYLTVPATDIGNGRGICGTLDFVNDNEFTHRDGMVESRAAVCPPGQHCLPVNFTRSWRNDRDQSFFDNPGTVQTSSTVQNKSNTHYCQCDNSTAGGPIVNCSVNAVRPLNNKLPCCPWPQPFPRNLSVWDPNPIRRSARAGLYVDRDDEYPVYISKVQTPRRKRDAVWPTRSGITEAAARDRCAHEMQGAQLSSKCSQGTKLYDNSIQTCVIDIMFMDTYDFIPASISAFTASCQLELLQLPESYTTTPTGERVVKPEVVNVCSMSCFRHGTCVNGRCVCSPGYAGSSCQLLAGRPVTLTRVRGASECDINERPCQTVFFDAENFEMGPNFKCRIRHLLPGGSLSTDYIDNPAHFITGNRLACLLPDAQVKFVSSVKTWSVSVTMDNVQYSNALTFTVYDATCQTCSGTHCTLKTNTCLINNLCYQNGDINPSDSGLSCKSALSTSQWSSNGHLSAYPDVSDPLLSLPAVDAQFVCTVQSSSHDPRTRFEVVWVFNNQEEFGPILLGDQRVATHPTLTARPLSAQCKVRSFYAGGNSFSPYFHSHAVFVVN